MSKRKVSLANKYRPATFSDMSEQASIKTILENQIKNNKLKGAYLFTGSAGVGKTSAARIIAGMMNEHKGRPIEMDCASHNGIEDMRKIIDDCRSRPIGTKYKIFILDECFYKDSLVKTVDGDKEICKLHQGDLVYTSSGLHPIKSVNICKVQSDRLCVLNLSNGNKIYTTKDHLFMTTNGWVEAKDLINKDELIQFTYMKNLFDDNNQLIQNIESQMYMHMSSNNIYIKSKPYLHNNKWQDIVYESSYIDKYKRLETESVFVDSIDIDYSKSGFTEMYDLTVQDDPTYFVNDILVHNCHMLTIQSWNGLLKLLEEPPEYVILLLCTTNPEKIPGTILSRVQRFNLARISTQGIINRLKYIIDSENKDFMQSQDLSESEIQLRNQLIQENKPYIQYEDSAISYIARLAKGGMRDSITNLEKCLDYSRDLTLDNVHTILSGGVNEQTLLEFLKYTLNKDSKGCLLHFNNIYMSGVDTLLFLKLYIEFLENCIKYIITQDANIVTLADDTLSWVFQNRNFIQEMRYQLLDALKIRNDYSSEDLKIVIESWIIQICNS